MAKEYNVHYYQNCKKLMEYLDFEKPIAEMQEKLEGLYTVSNDGDIDVTGEIVKLEERLELVTNKVFTNLSDWQIVQVARHPARPYFLDYIAGVFGGGEELHGDRTYSDDLALIGFLTRLNDKPVMVIGHQKGREVDEKVKRNFGMPKPEGYRKALRLMQLAEKFKLPVITFIDTPGAYPGIGAEERGQSEAIARNLKVMSRLRTPVVSLVIGEGGSGGALAIGVCDYLVMLQYSIYSVISPEGCASILWRDAKYAATAAKSMCITAQKLQKFGLVDEVVREPVGGAHRNPRPVYEALKNLLQDKLTRLQAQDEKALLAARYEKLMGFGRIG